VNELFILVPIATLALSYGVVGIRDVARGLRSPNVEPGKALRVMAAFRRMVIGLAGAGIAAGLAFEIKWLFWLSVAIGIEETIESSIAVWALRQGKELQVEHTRRSLPDPGLTRREGSVIGTAPYAPIVR
jgi:hypothetical protein